MLIKLHFTQRGFTLVELITVLVVLGIVSIVAIPRFSGTDTYAEFALQQRLKTALRTLQIKSMYDTRAGFCYKLNVSISSSSTEAAFGPATNNYQSGNESNTCANTIDFTAPSYLRSASNELSAQNIDIEALDSGLAISFVEFNSLGQPISSRGQCTAGCELSFIGAATAKVCISSQGYVHDC
ncbi:Tfp pilus assembly protein FimT/FimU [Ningiella sp. W23]|uniref:pilus assembly FimT family protein n=1 Tax=Ningiella sp. W23 TaxID=3023715 RepID=UPI003757E1EC